MSIAIAIYNDTDIYIYTWWWHCPPLPLPPPSILMTIIRRTTNGVDTNQIWLQMQTRERAHTFIYLFIHSFIHSLMNNIKCLHYIYINIHSYIWDIHLHISSGCNCKSFRLWQIANLMCSKFISCVSVCVCGTLSELSHLKMNSMPINRKAWTVNRSYKTLKESCIGMNMIILFPNSFTLNSKQWTHTEHPSGNVLSELRLI